MQLETETYRVPRHETVGALREWRNDAKYRLIGGVKVRVCLLEVPDASLDCLENLPDDEAKRLAFRRKAIGAVANNTDPERQNGFWRVKL